VGLVQAIAAGDQRALYALYQRAHRAAFTLIMRITNSRETAEELTVDVFHGVWQRAAQYDAASGSVLGWIMNQARSRAIDRLRFENRKKRVDPRADASSVETETHAEAILGLKQQGHRLRDALTILTPDERIAIETAFFAELTYPEVATRLNQPLGTIKTRIRSGLGKLRQVLASGAARS
jgi:RNA polymerase sigma-70 factor, ECF subfamily